MSLAIGIAGLSQAGKSTFFQALTCMSSQIGSGRRTSPVARVPVPDARIWTLAKHFNPKKTTPATVDFVDMPGGSNGGLGAHALGEIRNATALVEIVRCFDHPYLGGPDPLSDLETFEVELTLADLKVVEGKLERTKKLLPGELELLEKLHPPLAEGRPDQVPPLTSEELRLVAGLGLLCLKPRIYAANLSENGAAADCIHRHAQQRNTESLEACALLEAEVAELEADERQTFLDELGIEEAGLSKMVRAGYRRLGLLTFFTVGEDEVRAWTCREGSTAPQAAGVIHTDLERGFIRADVIHYSSFLECGSMASAKSEGKLRVEGKDYIVQDGDMLDVRFNV